MTRLGLFGVALVTVAMAYRLGTGRWPVSVEVDR